LPWDWEREDREPEAVRVGKEEPVAEEEDRLLDLVRVGKGDSSSSSREWAARDQ
jgi:hypothetical protein